MATSITDDKERARQVASALCNRFGAALTETLVEACQRHLRENKHVKDAPLMRYVAAAAIVSAIPPCDPPCPQHTDAVGAAVDFAATLLGVRVEVPHE